MIISLFKIEPKCELLKKDIHKHLKLSLNICIKVRAKLQMVQKANFAELCLIPVGKTCPFAAIFKAVVYNFNLAGSYLNKTITFQNLFILKPPGCNCLMKHMTTLNHNRITQNMKGP